MNIFNSEEHFILNKFNSHNDKLFSKIKNNKKGKKLFLVEFNGWPAIHIVFSYLINYFSYCGFDQSLNYFFHQLSTQFY